MSRIARKIKDKRVLHLIRKYLQAGIMINGVEETRNEGTPQGSPLSPLLANILLDELDKELEKRGHKFSRYADDCNIYVRTVKAGERVKESIGKFLEKRLRLKLNEEKSGVGKVHERSFLGYSFTNQEEKRIKISKGAIKRLKKKVKEIFRKGKGKNLKKMIIEELVPILRGWINYFRESEAGSILERIDGWIRRRLRAIIWRQCKKKYTRVKRMMKRGVSEEVAWQTGGSRTGRWRGTRNYGWHKAFPNAYFERLGLISLHQRWFALRSNS
jgi:RNA-directed DNA polymerase